MEQYFPGAEPINCGFNEGGDSKSFASTTRDEGSPSGGFECNICLDLVHDPVVTFCGHLYCWPCIYRWITIFPQNPDREKPQCPVCKAEVSEKTLIPLYGRGQMTTPSKDEPHPIPDRPSTAGSITDHSSPFDRHRHPIYRRRELHPHPAGNNTTSSPVLNLNATSLVVDPVIGMFGEMVYARIFGNSETRLYTYPNSYHLASSSTPRLQRQMLQDDKSLSRVCFFLFCCAMLCLVLF